jgi:AcrR family transcriptional regulator
MSIPPETRHDRRKQETRERIREAAVDLFAEQGFDATKVSEICEHADVARQTFFNHFPTKRDVLAELFEIGLDLMSVNLDAACEGAATTRERIARFYAATVIPAVEVGPFNRDVVGQVITTMNHMAHPEHARRISDIYLTLIERGLELGDVTRRYSPEALAETIEGGVATLMRDWSAGGGFDVVQRAEELAALAADAVEVRPDER